MKASASQEGYIDELVAEFLIGASLDAEITGYMLRGMDLEADARKFYSFQRDVDVQQVGFVLRDDRKVGASPDGRFPEKLETDKLGPAQRDGLLGTGRGADLGVNRSLLFLPPTVPHNRRECFHDNSAPGRAVAPPVRPWRYPS